MARLDAMLAIGSGIAAGYVLNTLFAPDAAIRTWNCGFASLGFMKEGLKLRLDFSSSAQYYFDFLRHSASQYF